MGRMFLAAFVAGLCMFPAVRMYGQQDLKCNSHDIVSLGNWGPYSKQYAGISFVEDISSGRRVDFTVVPGLYRRSYSVPNLLYESGCHPWKVTPDMRSITYRYELEWKDRVYVDATYDVLDGNRVRLSMKCVNNTGMTQNLLLHNVISMHSENVAEVRLLGADGVHVLYGCDYEWFEPAVRSHSYGLVYDGRMRGEEMDSNGLCGRVLGKFGSVGDEAAYRFSGMGKQSNAVVYVRCRVGKGKTAVLTINGGEEIGIAGTGNYEIVRLGTFPVVDGKCILRVTPTVNENIRIDALFAGNEEQLENIRVVPAPVEHRPRMDRSRDAFVAAYQNMDSCYAVAWDFPDSEIREFENSDLDVFMRLAVHRHPPKYFTGDRKGHFASAFLRPIVIAPNSDTTIVTMLAAGSRERVESAVEDFHRNGLAGTVLGSAPSGRDFLPESDRFAFGEQLLEATLLTNVVYPVYTQKEFIRHFTPGKNWNSLYTWDLGCISLALNEIDSVKAFETIRAYTTEEGAQSAFIHHGTPLPIQFFAFSELNSSFADREALDWLYPRLKRYYDYMMGHEGTSTTVMKSGLIRTWDYFYNSGGWDDYPPQHALGKDRRLYSSVAPVVSSAYYLRAAKIMRMYAEQSGRKKDAEQYDTDIKRLSSAIRKYAWDEESGYFGYVMHDSDGNPSGIFRYNDGSNYNMGLDGVSPLVGGCCDSSQAERLIGNIFSPERLWTGVGISTVDKSAPYYDPTGYWNGCVWIPHQYFIWKSLLDYGRPDLAEKVAFTALEQWNRECEETYNCFEHFIISSGRGAGWHNFSGLSSPMINFYNSYFRIGHIATGFEVSVDSSVFGPDHSSLDAVLRLDRTSMSGRKTVIVCMNPGYSYDVTCNGKKAEVLSPFRGLLYITVHGRGGPLALTIRPAGNGTGKTDN